MRVGISKSPHQYLRGKKALFLDVFDTTLIRSVQHPSDLFRCVEESLCTQGHDAKGFSTARIAAEAQARDIGWNSSGKVEVTFDEIYAQLKASHSHWLSWLLEAQQKELAFESAGIRLNPWIDSFIQAAKALQLPVYFVSDIYLKKSDVRGLLRTAGLEVADNHLFVSSEYNKSKSSGSLFPFVLSTTGLDPKEVFHLGDNPRSDGDMAKAVGISSLILSPHSLSQSATEDPVRSLVEGLSSNLERRIADEADGEIHLAQRIGYSVLGPLLAGLTLWIADNAKKVKLDHLYFLSRDGKIMLETYRRICERDGTLPEGRYLFASRRALNVASIEKLDATALDFLVSGNTRLRVRDFLHRLGLEPDENSLTFPVDSIHSLDQIVQPDQYGPLRQIFLELEPTLLRIAEKERKDYLSYLEEIGIMGDNAFGVVDIGWHGTMQESLIRLLDDELGSVRERVHGFYLGLHPGAGERMNQGFAMQGYITDSGTPEERYLGLRTSIEVVEFLFSAIEPSLIRMTVNSSKQVVPAFDSFPPDAKTGRFLERIQEEALNFVDDYLACFPKGCPPFGISPENAFRPLRRLLQNPTQAEAKRIGAVRFSDGFGEVQTFRRVAVKPSFPTSILHPNRFVRQFKESFWRMGFYRQMNASERWMLSLLSPIGSRNILPKK